MKKWSAFKLLKNFDARVKRKQTDRLLIEGSNMHPAITPGGRCYDHDFPRFLTIFGEKIGDFLKNQCYDQNFALFAFVLSQKLQFFFAKKICEKFLKIITSVPGRRNNLSHGKQRL
jgi:hypothetical protein